MVKELDEMEGFALLIVTGLSGAGKSLALARLEDNGYYCVDNLPSSLIGGFLEQCRVAVPAIRRAAASVDGRESAFGLPGAHVLDALDKQGVDYQVLFLDCKDEVLLRRYRETRRRHPFAREGDVASGIKKERELLLPLRERAHIVLDTSALTPLALFSKLDEALALQPAKQMQLLFTSFGFKRGMPIDADIVLDMRFLPNPFYEQALRPLSGLDEPVRRYVLEDAQAAPFFNAVEQMLLAAIPGYARSGKQRLMVAFGCTGGRHRSVAAAEELASRLNARYHTRCYHRDLVTEARDIDARFSI